MLDVTTMPLAQRCIDALRERYSRQYVENELRLNARLLAAKKRSYSDVSQLIKESERDRIAWWAALDLATKRYRKDAPRRAGSDIVSVQQIDEEEYRLTRELLQDFLADFAAGRRVEPKEKQGAKTWHNHTRDMEICMTINILLGEGVILSENDVNLHGNSACGVVADALDIKPKTVHGIWMKKKSLPWPDKSEPTWRV
ncbi:hypothetical protein [Vreelandella alkaliphila]|uniref:hypothetical protein n=1 Tax=Vreelandella alkaliphila TaxID=272774 RepID=UPI003FD8AD78